MNAKIDIKSWWKQLRTSQKKTFYGKDTTYQKVESSKSDVASELNQVVQDAFRIEKYFNRKSPKASKKYQSPPKYRTNPYDVRTFWYICDVGYWVWQLKKVVNCKCSQILYWQILYNIILCLQYWFINYGFHIYTRNNIRWSIYCYDILNIYMCKFLRLYIYNAIKAADLLLRISSTVFR